MKRYLHSQKDKKNDFPKSPRTPMDHYERERHDELINKGLWSIKIYMPKEILMGKNRISSSKGKKNDINFLTFK